MHADDRVRQRGDLREAGLKRVDCDGDGRVSVRCSGVFEDGFAYGTHVVASTHSAAAVPRIQRISSWCVSQAFSNSSKHAPIDLNVTLEAIFGAVQEPFSSAIFTSDSAYPVFPGAQRSGCGD